MDTSRSTLDSGRRQRLADSCRVNALDYERRAEQLRCEGDSRGAEEADTIALDFRVAADALELGPVAGAA